MAYFGLFLTKNFFSEKSKIRPEDDFFREFKCVWTPHKRPQRTRKNTLEASKIYHFCQLKTHFSQISKICPSASQVSKNVVLSV